MGAAKTLRRAGLLIGPLALGLAATAEPVFRNVFKLDAEYALDRQMGETPWDDRDRFAAAPTGFRVSAGSLNIRHFLVRQNLKARFPIIEDRFWFRFRHDRDQGLERDENAAQLELEARASERFFLSLLGDVVFHKSDVMAGAAVRYGAAEERSLKLSYLWPGFDTNYAFANTSVNEGYREAYRRMPGEARLEANWIAGRVSALFTGRLGRGWELEREDFSPPERSLERGKTRQAAADVRWRGDVWRWGLEGEHWRSAEGVVFDPARPAEDRASREELSRALLSLERDFGARTAARIAGGPSSAGGTVDFPGDPAAADGYRLRDWIGLFEVRRRFSGRFSGEAMYLADRQWRRWVQGPAEDVDRRVHQRGKVGLRYDLSERAFVRAIGAIELDRSDSETFFSFDGGTVQFQTTF